MADIEERAEQWAKEYMTSENFEQTNLQEDLITAYLAGVAQTQKDYTA